MGDSVKNVTKFESKHHPILLKRWPWQILKRILQSEKHNISLLEGHHERFCKEYHKYENHNTITTW